MCSSLEPYISLAALHKKCIIKNTSMEVYIRNVQYFFLPSYSVQEEITYKISSMITAGTSVKYAELSFTIY